MAEGDGFTEFLDDDVTRFVFYSCCFALFLGILLCCVVTICRQLREQEEDGNYKNQDTKNAPQANR